jgi:hypothetical protein
MLRLFRPAIYGKTSDPLLSGMYSTISAWFLVQLILTDLAGIPQTILIISNMYKWSEGTVIQLDAQDLYSILDVIHPG